MSRWLLSQIFCRTDGLSLSIFLFSFYHSNINNTQNKIRAIDYIIFFKKIGIIIYISSVGYFGI